MSPAMSTFISLDLPAMLAGTLAALVCALLGSFLVLRRQALMGDAISHAVLPGIVLGFFVANSRHTLPIFLGAGASALITVLMINALRRIARVEAGAAMGVSFSIMFALGVLLIEQSSARGVDLDAECVLYGQLEYVNWYPPASWDEFWTWATFRDAPRQVVVLLGATLVALAFIGLFYKELRITTFDPAHATAIGISSGVMGGLLMTLVAGATVAAFEAVGSILVIAMLITPPATARLLTDRFGMQIFLSAVLAILTGVGGYLIGAFGLELLGFEGRALNVAGTMTVLALVLLTLAIVFAPTHGVLAGALRRRALATQIARDDLLGLLYRVEESGAGEPVTPGDLTRAMRGAPRARAAIRRLRRDALITADAGRVSLTPAGRAAASRVVRSHRLWESWLVDRLGLRPDHVHETAERLEHLRTDGRRLQPDDLEVSTDPHERPIPDDDDG